MLLVRRVVERKGLLARRDLPTRMAMVPVEELACVDIGAQLPDASRVTSATTPMIGMASTTVRRDVGSVPVWITWPRIAQLVIKFLEVPVTKAPKEAREVKVSPKTVRMTRAKVKAETSRPGEWIRLQRIHNLKLPRFSSLKLNKRQ